MANTHPVFQLITCTPSPSAGATITWKLDRNFTPDEADTFSAFRVEYGQPGGSWTTVGTTSVSNSVTDVVRRQYAVLDDGYYRVVLVMQNPAVEGHEEDEPTFTEYTSQPVSGYGGVSRQDWTVVRGMLRDMYFKLSRVTGKAMLWVPRRQYGTVCTTCINPDSDEPQSPRCPECFGTGISGGYFGAHAIIGEAAKPVATTRQFSDTGPIVDAGTYEVDFPAYPLISVKDLMVDPSSGNIFEVSVQGVTGSYRNLPVRQKTVLTLLPRSALEYTVPLAPAEDGWTSGISMFARII